MQRSALFSLLLTSIVSMCVSCLCFVGVTFAWFTDLRTTYGSDLSSGIMSVELMHADIASEEAITSGGGVTLSAITEDYPLFSFETEFIGDTTDEEFTGFDIRKYIAVVNEGSLKAEYNIGLTVEIEEDTENLGDIIDVFYAFASEDDVINKPGGIGSEEDSLDFIYLGKLSEFSSGTAIYLEGPGDIDAPNPDYLDEFGNQTIRIKGILEPAISGAAIKEDLSDTKDYYCIRLKFPKTAEQKYEGASFTLSAWLEANNSINDLVDITTGTNDEMMGLVLGGGTYYKAALSSDGGIEIASGKAILKTIPMENYKFKEWTTCEDADGNPLLEPVQDEIDENVWYIPLDGDAKYIAEFVKASEFEEGTGDNPFDDWDDEPDDSETGSEETDADL